jgi:hypothetical protein
MERKIIIKTKHKYHLLNPYYGGAESLLYSANQAKALVHNKNLLSTQDDILQLIIRNPIHLN